MAIQMRTISDITGISVGEHYVVEVKKDAAYAVFRLDEGNSPTLVSGGHTTEKAARQAAEALT